jgi:hypothetical protein
VRELGVELEARQGEAKALAASLAEARLAAAAAEGQGGSEMLALKDQLQQSEAQRVV